MPRTLAVGSCSLGGELVIDAILDVGSTRRESHRALSRRVCVDEPIELRRPDIEEGGGRDTDKGALGHLVNRARRAGAQVVRQSYVAGKMRIRGQDSCVSARNQVPTRGCNLAIRSRPANA
jgi:hypothetical protein